MSNSESHLGSAIYKGSVGISTHKALHAEALIDRKSAEQKLEKMRTQIAEIDRAFLDLLRQRMDLSAEIGCIKEAIGQALFVPEVHKLVLARARSSARACGISEKVMESIYEAVMEGSIERQQRAISELHARVATSSERVSQKS
jgi:chorismate mutase